MLHPSTHNTTPGQHQPPHSHEQRAVPELPPALWLRIVAQLDTPQTPEHSYKAVWRSLSLVNKTFATLMRSHNQTQYLQQVKTYGAKKTLAQKLLADQQPPTAQSNADNAWQHYLYSGHYPQQGTDLATAFSNALGEEICNDSHLLSLNFAHFAGSNTQHKHHHFKALLAFCKAHALQADGIRLLKGNDGACELLTQCTRLTQLILSHATVQQATLAHILPRFTQLRSLHLQQCQHLSHLPPELGTLTALQKLIIKHCNQLSWLPNHISQLQQLSTLTVSFCAAFETLPNDFGVLKLRALTLSHCHSLTHLPTSFSRLSALQHCAINHCALRILPHGIAQLQQLKLLDMRGCRHLHALPTSMGSMTQLTQLSLLNCSKMSYLPQGIIDRVHSGQLQLSWEHAITADNAEPTRRFMRLVGHDLRAWLISTFIAE